MLVNLGDLLEDVQPQRVAFADLGRDAEGDADILTFDIDRLGEVVAAGGRFGSTGHDRNIVADDDLGFFVVRGQNVRGRDDVDVAYPRQWLAADSDAAAVALVATAPGSKCVSRIVEAAFEGAAAARPLPGTTA